MGVCSAKESQESDNEETNEMEEAKARTRSLSSANLEAEEQQEAKEHAKEVAKEKASRKELHCILRFGDTRVSVKFMVTDATRMQELSEELHYELSAQFEMIEKYTDCIPTFVALVPLWRSKPEAAAEDATMESLQDQPQAVPANSGPLRIYVHHDEDEPPRDYWQGKGASFWEEAVPAPIIQPHEHSSDQLSICVVHCDTLSCIVCRVPALHYAPAKKTVPIDVHYGHIYNVLSSHHRRWVG